VSADADSSLPLSVLTALTEKLDEYADAVRRVTQFHTAAGESYFAARADRDAKRAALLHSLREMAQRAQSAERFYGTVERTAADRLAHAVCTMIDRHALDARSLAGDALLDYAEIRHGTSEPIAAVRATSGVPSSVVPAVDPSRSYPDAVQALPPRTPQPETRSS
jgi:hypothetical protein